MSYQKIIASIVVSIFAYLNLNGQNGNYELKTVLPPSATVASLGKYGEIPVSLYTGIPNISIPLYEIKDGPLSVPISISYHAAGIRVEEIASNVGLGWALNAGGIVGRQQRGRPDEYGGWITPAAYRVDNIMQNGTQAQINAMSLEIENGTKDAEPDIYYYNFNGQSGKFFFDQAGTVYNYPEKNVSVIPISDFEDAAGWKITTEDGTIYEFDKIEKVNSGYFSAYIDRTTAWYLTKIKSADGKREITFTYEDVTYSNDVVMGESAYIDLPYSQGNCLDNPGVSYATNTTYTHRLKRIDFSGGYIKFSYESGERQDLAGEKRLDLVEIFAAGDKLIKKYDFAYSYFGSGSSDQYGKRLKLTSLTEKSAIGQKPPHVFTYEESVSMPHRNSPSKDHWGYYNGKTNTNQIASFEFYDEYSNATIYYPGADRNANPATMQACVLKNIKYPTGGETYFTYETNTTADIRIQPITYDDVFSFSLNQSFASLTSPYETSSFVIPAQGATIQFLISGLASSAANCDAFQCYLIKDNNSTPYRVLSDDNGSYGKLPGGTYKLRFTFDCFQGNLNFNITFNAKIPVVSLMGKRPVGGLRIKQIEDNPGNGGQPIIKKYRYDGLDTSQSSGVLVNFPEYGYVLEAVRMEPATPGGSCIAQLITYCRYISMQSTTNYPMATSRGAYVGYQYVTEDLMDNGEVLHHYLAYTTPSASFPFPPVEDFDWRRGSETYTKYYAKKNGQLILSKQMDFGYVAIDTGVVRGYKTGRNYIYVGTCASDITYGVSYGSAPLTMYEVKTEFYALTSAIERTYDQNDPNKYIETTVNYTYNSDHFQVAQIRTSTSSNDATIKDEVVVKKKYPQDYNFTGSPSGAEALGVKKLKDLHIVNVPVEEYSYRQKRNISTDAVSDQRVVGGMITTFKSDNPYPAEVFRLETNATIPLSTYGTGSAISSNAFIKNANSTIANAYKSAVVFNSYDDKGNLLQQQKANDVVTSYLWGYSKNYPVAQVVGATHSTISTYITQSTLDAPSSDAALRTHLNSIRTNLASSKALVTTYTYKPLVGQTSVTDPNNRSNYYEYDDFGRLNLVRDQDNNILKKYCYNYYGQAENCITYASTDQSGNYYSQNCTVNETPVAYYVSVPATMFYSTVSVNDANTQAQQYAQQLANQNGTCQLANITINYTSTVGGSCYNVVFTDVVTNEEFYYQIGGTSGTLATLPAGTYNVGIFSYGCDYGNYRTFQAGCNYTSNSDGSAGFYNVAINNSCKTIAIY